MEHKQTVDARGLYCEASVLARQAIDKLGTGTIEVLVDTDTALDYVFRLGKHFGWQVDVADQPDGSFFRIVLQK
jgi:TusA-related sulfurtransferase